MSFPFQKQHDNMDCGPSCLQMVAAYYGRKYKLETIKEYCNTSKTGVSFQSINAAAEKIGMRALGVKTSLKKLSDNAPFPCILHWNQNHFVVLYKIKKNQFYIADPASGIQKLNKDAFLNSWLNTGTEGAVLLIEPTPEFYNNNYSEKSGDRIKGFKYLMKYLQPYKGHISLLFLSLIAGTSVSLVFPFLTQGIVDYGINKKDLTFVQLMLISQLVLFIGGIILETIRSWLMLHMNARINIAIISDFLIKLMKLPISFFDTRHIGDIKQRIGDHSRVQSFLTGSSLSTIFSLVNLGLFTVIMGMYSINILMIFMAFSALSVFWIVIFLRRRKQLDYIRFQRASANENIVFELISGMQEIKLNNCETSKRWKWEGMQVKLFQLGLQSLALGQIQSIGSSFFNQLKNIVISYVSAREVISGHITLGMMMSISYIVGQLNSPIQQLLGFLQSAQDAKISLDRLGEIHSKEDEETPDLIRGIQFNRESRIRSDVEPFEMDLILKNVSFTYQGSESEFVLKDLNLTIPSGKVTAIVGMSGSGKTTLMKLLLKYYSPIDGNIDINGYDLKTISPEWWRKQCGAVMQEGYIFNDTIAGNIVLDDSITDYERLKIAVKVANIKEFIEQLPLGYNTIIGYDGHGLSSGQKQRILIARAIYKMPSFLLFDEATSTLDAHNERVIMDNLNQFFKGKTVVVIAHRLSTVKNADQIIVLDKGSIAELGNHQSLIEVKGKYYDLVRNQLELNFS